MKLLLLQPPIQDFYDTDIRLQPIGLAYLKAIVHQHLPGVQVVIKDYHHGWRRQTIKVPKELGYLRDYYAYRDESPFSTFHQYFHFGADFETIAQEALEEKPDLIGISSLFSPYYREVLRCADEIKCKLAVPILVSGSHVSARPEMMLEHPSIDFVIRGEGERPLVEFLKVWQSSKDLRKVPNLGFKEKGNLILNPLEENFPVDELPVPDFSDFSREDYLFEKKPLAFIVTSRGCPHRCQFCSVHQTFGEHYRKRSAQKVLEEIKQRYSEGFRVFDFEDDNLTFYQDEMKTLCRNLIQEFSGKDIQFLAMNGISYLSSDHELLELMKQAGFTHLNIALASSNPQVCAEMKRPHDSTQYLEVVHSAFSLGFKTVSYQILGLPNEKVDSMIKTLILNTKLPVLLGASLFYLTPDAAAPREFPEAEAEMIFKSRLTAMAIETEHFKREDIYTLFITSRIINFLKGLSFSENEILLSEAFAFARKQDKRSEIGVSILERFLRGESFQACTDKGYKTLSRFKSEVFFQAWKQLDFVTTQEGKKILLLGAERVGHNK